MDSCHSKTCPTATAMARHVEVHVQTQDDFQQVSRFMSLINVPEPKAACVGHLLHKAVGLLRLCGYCPGDINLILAHASVYYDDALIAAHGRTMDEHETANVLVTLIYIAHAYVEDNTCPLNVWHQRLCRDYCQMRLLNQALFKLLRMRGFILRVDDEELSTRCSFIESRRAGPPALAPVPVPVAAVAPSLPCPSRASQCGLRSATPTHQLLQAPLTPAGRAPAQPVVASRAAPMPPRPRAGLGLPAQPWGGWMALTPGGPGPVSLSVCG